MTASSSRDALDVVADLKRPIQQWVRGWMQGPRVGAVAARLGLRDAQQLWIVGRAGVLGDAPADVAIGALAFIAPDVVRDAWTRLPADLSHRTVADAYVQLCVEWGDAELSRFPAVDLERLDHVARLVIDAAPASLGPLFAGWRAVEQPATPAGRVALSMHVLREQRGAAHITAVVAGGLTPLQAVLASPAPPPRTGPAWAEHLGWRGPFDSAELFAARRRAAEGLTNTILAPYYAALEPSGLADLASLLAGIRDQIDM